MADTIPWSDPDGTRTLSARDTALMAAWRTFMSLPRLGNTHDWLWAAIVHGYDTGVAVKVGSDGAAARVTAYLNELDRVDSANVNAAHYADDVHGINDLMLTRSDLRAILACALDAASD